MMVLSALLLAFVGFTIIASSMDRHVDDLPFAGSGHLMLWRVGGWLLLAASLLPCLVRWNTSVALAAWLGLLTFAALALALALTYAPRWVRRLSPAIGVVATIVGIVGAI